jgi:hypothetical protein
MADGLLTSILGAIDRQKQTTKAGLGLLVNDPMEFARNATARYFPTPEEVAQQRAIEQAGGDTFNTPYMDKMFNLAQFGGPIAYHGSPSIFSKFDINKVGTGEGAQAYGHGMYFAESPNVAKEYQEKLSSTGSAKNLISKFGGVDEGIAEASKRIEHYKQLIASGGGGAINRARGMLSISEKNLQDLQRMKQGLPENTGGFYKVDIPDKSANTFLDWDKKISDQKQIKDAFYKINDKYNFGYDNNYSGGDFYKALTVDFIRTGKAKNEMEAQKLVSNELNNLGVGGVRYFDAASRGGKQGTSNYVVFDPSTVKILERNNQPVKGLLGK